MSQQTVKPDAVGVGIIFMGVTQRQTLGTLKLPAAGSWLCSVMWACVLITTPPHMHIYTKTACFYHTYMHTFTYTHCTLMHIYMLHTYHVFIPYTQIHAYINTTHTPHMPHTYTHTLLHTHTLPVHTIHIDTYTAHTIHTYILSG